MDPKIKPMSNSGLEKCIETFIMKNQIPFSQLAFLINVMYVLISNPRLSLKSTYVFKFHQESKISNIYCNSHHSMTRKIHFSTSTNVNKNKA